MLDVRLPDLSGLQAYERIRAIDERIPVIWWDLRGINHRPISAYLGMGEAIPACLAACSSFSRTSAGNRIPAV